MINAYVCLCLVYILWMDTANLYLTDSASDMDNGDFCMTGHYEVHAGERPALATPQATPQCSFAFMQASSSSPQAFNFTPPLRASTVRSDQR